MAIYWAKGSSYFKRRPLELADEELPPVSEAVP
jgi:hypothetical protein